MHLFWQDLRYGARRLAKDPGFAAVALGTLALGIGATTAIFSVVDTVLLKPLPFREPERLLVIWEKNPAMGLYKMFVAPANFLAWQEQSHSVESMAAVQDGHYNLTGGPNGAVEPEELKVEKVSASLFPLLGVEARVGRTFLPGEDRPGHANFAVLSYSLWHRRFAAARDIAGKTIRLREQPYTVVGVLPPDFAVMEPGVDVFLPLGLNASDTRAATARNLTVIARRRGSSGEVRAELDALGARLEQAQPALNVGYRPSAFELGDELVGGVKRSMWVLMAAVACLLAMACVNVANLLLARGAARRKEVALRTALGAGRGRIVVQLLSESILLALGGGALGLLVAAAAIRLVAHAGPASVPRLALAALDARVYVFTFGVSLGTGILFGLAPALQGAAGSLSATLKDTTRGGTAGRSARRVRSSLVVAELALAVVVLIGAGLLIRSFIRLRSVDAGFQPAGLLTVRVPLSGARYSTPERKVAFLQQALSRIATLPGVRSVGMVDGLPLTGLGFGGNFAVEGRPPLSTEQRLPALLRAVSPSYFGTMGIPLVTGRLLADSDTAQAPPVILISRTLARRFWPNGNPIGGHIVIDRVEGKVHEIVGVVGDVKADRVDGEAWSTIYRPFTQAPNGAITLAIRTTGPPLSLASAVTREVHRLDAAQPVADVRTMEDVVSLAISGARFQTVLLMCFASVAFLLASVGIYGVISYDVSQRTNEIGVRMALGAQASDVRRLILGQGARLAVYGITAGLLGAVVVTRWMGALLFGVPPADPGTYAAIAVLLAAVALGASYAPSRRAMKLDPVAALKHE